MVSVLADHGNHLSTPWKVIETPRPRSKLSHMSFSGQLSPPLGPCYSPITFWHHPGSQRGPIKGWILSYPTLHTIPLSVFYFGPPSHLPLAWLFTSILSHSHAISLSLFYFGPPTHLPVSRFLACCLVPDWSAQSTGLLYPLSAILSLCAHSSPWWWR
jgi:hypothetical protein